MNTCYRFAQAAAALLIGQCLLVGNCLALTKQVSLITKQPIGDLAVAGLLSIDLHAEFMVSRTYEKDTVLNWYNCGYSGGGNNTSVGGDFGDFGFQVPYKERDAKYPRAVTIGNVRAVHFDGNDILKGNFSAESQLVGTKDMAIEVWLRNEKPAKGEVILGWQSRDGAEASAPLIYPNGFSGSDKWRHLVVNCSAAKEQWYLDGVLVSSGKRMMILKEVHVMVLGGASADKPSFKGDLAAVRLHDAAMTEEQIAHNFKGGVMLGTEMHNWWRTEPDKWWVKESEHFRHCVDKKEMAAWTSQQLKEFNEQVPLMFDMAEMVYHTYSERLAMRSSVVSVQRQDRGDGIKYKIPIQPNEGSVMGSDGHFGWSCQGAGHINPHELVHGWQSMTGGMAGSFWEAHANFPQTYNGIYQTLPPSLVSRVCMYFPAHGRNYYHDRLMFEHLAQTPEYGPMSVSKLWYDGPTATEKNPYPWIVFDRVFPHARLSFSDEYMRMLMRNVTWDYITYVEAAAGKGNTPYGNDHVVSPVNRYQEDAKGAEKDIQRYSRITLEKIPYEPEWWRVPKEMAPQQLGWNICPMTAKPGKVSAMLSGYVDPQHGADWRAGFVGVDADSQPVYGEIAKPGQLMQFEVGKSIKQLYLVVCATPSKLSSINMVGDFRSFEQEPFPYKVKLAGCEPLNLMISDKAHLKGAHHANGGGYVESSAKVDATAFVGPNARVLGNSKVLGNASILDYAVVQDSTVCDRAVVSGFALVSANSMVQDDAKVRDYARATHAIIKDDAKILEHAEQHDKTCSGNAVLKGGASSAGNVSGTAMIDGSYAKSNEVTKGKWFTWSWSTGKNDGELDEEFGGLYADYLFTIEHPWMAHDVFGATWGYLVNNPAFAVVSDMERAKPIVADAGAGTPPANRVLVLNGKNQFVELPKDVADMGKCTYTAEFKWDGARDATRVFEFTNSNGDALWLSPSEKGRLIFGIRKGAKIEGVAATKAANKGEWVTVRVVLNGPRASIFLNGVKVGENPRMTLRPDSVAATQCYLGRGLKGGLFGGMIGRFTIHSVALTDRIPQK
ncbi:MAG: hypothetical protein DVB25_00020 [Verrucomicrobia bacterium]|nr:MAG: hypothetical protein DVB25_00020 [Verrucomicrobiota bacterium]